MEEDKVSEKDFVHEQIKEVPFNRRKVLIRIGLSAVCGLTFALSAVFVLILCAPILQPLWKGQSGDSGGKQENADFVSDITETGDSKETEQQEVRADSTENMTDGSFAQADEDESQKSRLLKRYQRLQNELYSIGGQAQNFMVTITSVTSSTDWFNSFGETQGQGAGVVYQKKGGEYRILTNWEGIADVGRIRVTFCDGTAAEASLKGFDAGTGLAVLAVDASQMDAVAKQAIELAQFGDTDKVANGAVVIALGSILGTGCSILPGTVISTDNEISLADRNYGIFTTDIAVRNHGSGVLIDDEGKVIGFMLQEKFVPSGQNTLAAISISSMQPVMECLSKGKQIPYLGLCISTVTDELVEKYHLPKGVYIKSVEVDSPAMEGGLQCGDVITAFNGNSVMTAEEYQDAVLALQTGENCSVTVKRQNGADYAEITCEVQVSVLK